MNEKEYYVQINKSLWNTLKPLQLGGVGKDLCPDEYGYGQYFIAEYDPEMSYVELNKDSFTTSELTEIMDGAILKRIPGGVTLDELGKDKSCMSGLRAATIGRTHSLSLCLRNINSK